MVTIWGDFLVVVNWTGRVAVLFYTMSLVNFLNNWRAAIEQDLICVRPGNDGDRVHGHTCSDSISGLDY